MKNVRAGVRCQYWNSPIYFEFEVEDDATQDDIEKQAFEMALQEASFDSWVEQPQTSAGGES